MKHFSVQTFANSDELTRAAARQWFDVLKPERNQPHLVALSGGRIAAPFFSVLVEQAKSGGVPLDHVHFFWADERCVPPESDQSNFALANRHLFEPLAIQPDHIHRLKGEIDADAAAADAIKEIKEIAPEGNDGQPVLDMIFLGVGEDGHVASLFPDAPSEVIDANAPYLAVIGSKPPPKRITLSYPAIAAAREVWVLVSGKGKAAALHDSLSPEGEQTPLARVLKSRSHTRIFTDIQGTGIQSTV